MMKKLIAVCLLLFVAGYGNLAFSQSSAVSNDQADATVDVFTALTITNINNSLDFGDILSDETSNQSIDPQSEESNSAKWNVTGSSFSGTTVNLSFTLPSNLVNSNSDQIPMSFGAGDAVWHSSDDVGNGTAFNPDNGVSNIDFSSGGANGEIWVWLGGTLAISGSAVEGSIPEGTYTGDITFTADYGF